MSPGRARARRGLRVWLTVAAGCFVLVSAGFMSWGVRPASDATPVHRVPEPSAPAVRLPAADLSGSPAPVVATALPRPARTDRSRVVSGDTRAGKMVALTFDDNYAPERAVPVLQALARVQVPATVFLTGGPTRSYPQVTALITRDPLLEVGDHAGTHTELRGMSPAGLEAEVGAGVAAFRELTGRHTSRLFRPPGGHYDAAVLQTAGQKGFPWTVGFSAGPADYEGLPAREVLHGIVSGEITPGPLVLLHLNGDHTAALIPELVGALRARGYRLGTVSQLLKGEDRWLDLDPTDPGYGAALTLDRADIVDGYPTGDYGTWEPMSRVDLAWALAHLLGPEAETMRAAPAAASAMGSPLDFADVVVAGGDPVAPLCEVGTEQRAAIETCVRAGLMQGATDAAGNSIFWPWSSVRRVDLALAVAQALGPRLPGESSVSPADVPEEAGRVMARVAAVGLMDTPEGGSGFDPVGRLEAAVVLYRLAEVLRPELVGAGGLPAWWRGPR